MSGLPAADSARESVVGIDVHVRGPACLQPGQWTSDLLASLARVTFNADQLRDRIFASEPSWIDGFQELLTSISARAHFLHNLDLSVDDSLALHDACFPGTTDPIPLVMTPTDTIRFLRLDVVTTSDGSERSRAMSDAMKTLDHLVSTGKLVSRRLSKSRVFDRADVLRLVAKV